MEYVTKVIVCDECGNEAAEFIELGGGTEAEPCLARVCFDCIRGAMAIVLGQEASELSDRDVSTPPLVGRCETLEQTLRRLADDEDWPTFWDVVRDESNDRDGKENA